MKTARKNRTPLLGGKPLPTFKDVEGKSADELTISVKLFLCGTDLTWYVVAFDRRTRTLLAFVTGPYPELGYVSLTELEQLRGPFGFRVERDTCSAPTEVMKEHSAGALSNCWRALNARFRA